MPNFFFLLAIIIIFSQSRLQFWQGREGGRGMLSAVARTPFLNGGPARNHALRRAERSRAGDDRGVKEMAVNNKVAATGRPLHPRQRESPICVS